MTDPAPLQLVVPVVEVDPEIVESLASLLEDARAGRIACVAIAAEMSDGETMTHLHVFRGIGGSRWGPLLLGIEIVRARLIDRIMGGLVGAGR